MAPLIAIFLVFITSGVYTLLWRGQQLDSATDRLLSTIFMPLLWFAAFEFLCLLTAMSFTDIYGSYYVFVVFMLCPGGVLKIAVYVEAGRDRRMLWVLS